MKTAIEIMNEPDPFLREAYAMGYDEVIKNEMEHCFSFINKAEGIIKNVGMADIMQFSFKCKIITAQLINGKIHRWISEADGSAERFRNLIKNEN